MYVTRVLKIISQFEDHWPLNLFSWDPFLKVTALSKVVSFGYHDEYPFVFPPHITILPLWYEKNIPLPHLLQGPVSSGFGLLTISAIMMPVV
jgi:hypothetical protein